MNNERMIEVTILEQTLKDLSEGSNKNIAGLMQKTPPKGCQNQYGWLSGCPLSKLPDDGDFCLCSL